MSEVNSTENRNHKISLGIVIGAIVVVSCIVIWQLTRALRTDYSQPDTEMETVVVTNVETEEPVIEEHRPGEATIIDRLTVDEQKEDEYINHELTIMMAALGIDDDTLAADSSSRPDEVLEAYLKENPNQLMVEPGVYQAYEIYENDDEKNLQALWQQGYNITITVYPDGTYESEYIGLKAAKNYDNYYFYYGDPITVNNVVYDKTPYLWDGETLHIAIHAVDAYLYRVGDAPVK